MGREHFIVLEMGVHAGAVEGGPTWKRPYLLSTLSDGTHSMTTRVSSHLAALLLMPSCSCSQSFLSSSYAKLMSLD